MTSCCLLFARPIQPLSPQQSPHLPILVGFPSMHGCLSLPQCFCKSSSDATAAVSRALHSTAPATTVPTIPARIAIDSVSRARTLSWWRWRLGLAIRRASGWRWRGSLSDFFKVSRWCPTRCRFVKTRGQPPSCSAFRQSLYSSLHRLIAAKINIPLFSFCVTRMISSLPRLSSPALWPAKSYSALYRGSFGCGGAACACGGGGGGGGARAEPAETVRV